jgi:hypothetical protein
MVEIYNTSKPIPLGPLKFNEAVSDLLKVKPEQKPPKKAKIQAEKKAG